MPAIRVTYRGNHQLEMITPKGIERLKIRSGWPENKGEFPDFFLTQFGLMHLIAARLPDTVTVDFPVNNQTEKLVAAMYRSENRKPPHIIGPRTRIPPQLPDFPTTSSRALITYSGGKDSMYNLARAQDELSPKNVRALHIAGLNRSNASDERKASLRQSEELGFHLDVINLLNSSKNSGYEVMRSRDIFFIALAAPIALMNGASRIFIEGFTEETPDEPFTGKEESMRMLNNIFRQWSVPLEVAWYDYEEVEAIGHLLIHRPGWLTLVQNCFCIPVYKPSQRKRLLQNLPTFHLLDSQCGVCMKCRMTNLARILYAKHDPTMRKVSSTDISRYIASTVRWAVENHEKLADYIDGSFLKYLRIATQKFAPESLAKLSTLMHG